LKVMTMRISLAISIMALCLLPAKAAPAVYWMNDPVSANDTVVVSGSDLSRVQSVEIARLADDDKTAAGKPVNVPTLQANPLSVKFILPSDLPDGVYQWRIDNGRSAMSGLLNAPTVYWFQGDLGSAASPGGWVRVMGRNIARTKQAQIEWTSPGRAARKVKASDPGLWDASFPVPADLEPGRWSLTLANGHGGARAQRALGTIEVRPCPLPPSTLVNIRDFGAKGDGGADDSEAFQKAFQAARGGGATVFLPRGNYLMTRTLEIPEGVTLSGESRENTFLTWADTETPPPALIDGFANFTLQNLTIVAGRHFHVIHGGFPRADGAEDGENIVLRNLRIRAQAFQGHLNPADQAKRQQDILDFAKDGVDSIGLAGRNLVVENCDVVGSSRALFLLRPRFARIQENSLTNGRQGWYSISGPDGVIFENNEISGADLESAGGGVNTMFARVAYSVNVLVKNNRFRRLSGWDGEALTTDGPGGFYFGRVSALDDTTLAMRDQPADRSDYPDWRGAGAFVMYGAGTGEWARVTSRDGQYVRLDHPLPTPPDDTSLVAIVPLQGRHLILNNDFEDATFAVQLFGTALENVIANNRSSRTEGFFVKALDYQHVQPSWRNQLLGNEIREIGLSGSASISVWGHIKDAPQSLAMNLMTIVRNNRLASQSRIELRGQAPYPSLVSNPVVEHNVVGAPVVRAIVQGEGVLNAVIRSNTASDPTQ